MRKMIEPRANRRPPEVPLEALGAFGYTPFSDVWLPESRYEQTRLFANLRAFDRFPPSGRMDSSNRGRRRMARGRKEYMVSGIYHDNNQVFVDHVEATTPLGAFRKASAIMESNSSTGGRVVSIIEGRHMDICPAIADAA